MAILIDQANAGEFAQDTAGSTIPVTTSQTIAAGGFIVVSLTWLSAGTPSLSNVTGGGLSWNIDVQGNNINGANVGAAICSAQCPAGLASGTTITGNLSASASAARSIGVTSFTGVLTAAALGVSGTTGQTAGTAAWSTSSATIAAGSVLVGLGVDFISANTSIPTSPSIEAHDFNAGGTSFAQTLCYRIEAVGGSYTVAGTWDASVSPNADLWAEYKAAAGVTPSVSPTYLPRGLPIGV